MKRVLVVACFACACAVSACGSLLGANDDDEPKVVDASKNDAGFVIDAGMEDGETTVSASGDAAVDADGDAPDGPSTRTERVIFVTTGARTGDFGSPAIADALCNSEATAAGLVGPGFVAWLSVEGNVATNAKARLTGTAPWYLVNGGGRVFAGPAAIANGSFPEHGIATNAKGAAVTGTVWTNTRQDGTSYQSDCAMWGDQTQNGVVGIIGAIDEKWTGSAAESCATPRHFICFEK